MKKFIVSALSVCSLLSCSPDEATIENTGTSRNTVQLKNISPARNYANSFDYAGAFHSQLLDDYTHNYNSSTDLSAVINNVEAAAYEANFNSFMSDYNGLSIPYMAWVIDNTDNTQSIINATDMSSYGKSVMLNFTVLLDTFENEKFDKIYTAIVSFESDILNDQSLTNLDKQTILVTTSTARYSIYSNKGGPRGWTRTRAGIAASINDEMALAVTSSVTANIMAE